MIQSIVTHIRFIPVAQKKGMAFLKTFSCNTFSYASKKWLVQTEFNSTTKLDRSQSPFYFVPQEKWISQSAGLTSTTQICSYCFLALFFQFLPVKTWGGYFVKRLYKSQRSDW